MAGPKPARRAGRHARREPIRPLGGGASIVDLHTHTLRSDGVLEPQALVEAVAGAGVRTLSITDHDNLAAYRELMAGGALPSGLELIAGVEINALAAGIKLEHGELHILGFGMDPADAAFEAALVGQRTQRRLRFERTLARLRELGLGIDEQLAQLDLARDDALGRPTIGRGLIAAGHATSVEDAFRRLIGVGMPAYLHREGMGPRDAIEAILAAGGVPVLAHFSEAPNQIPLLRELRDMGLAGLEVYYISYPPEVVDSVDAVARELRLIGTGGSDYHGDTSTYAETHAALVVPDAVAGRLREATAAARAAAPGSMSPR